MTPKAKLKLTQLGLDTRTIDAIALLADFLDGHQEILEHEENSDRVNKNIRNTLSPSQEHEKVREILNLICEHIGFECDELREYNELVEKAKEEENELESET